MSRSVVTGSADQSIRVCAYNSSGVAITGEAYNSAGIAVSVVVRSAGRIISTTALTLVARSGAGVHTDSAFTEVSGGEYVVDLPDSYFATAERDISVTLTSTAIAGGYVLSETLAVGRPAELNTDTQGQIDALTRGLIAGVVGSSSSTTVVNVTSTESGLAVTDQLKGRVIIFNKDTTTAALRGQGAPIDTNDTTSITVASGDAFTTAPASGDTFTIY